MKTIISILLILIFSKQVNAQVAIADQPDSSYYSLVVKVCKPFTPKEYDIVNVKPNKLPVSMADTLKKYDWYRIGSFGYTEATLRTPFSKLSDQFDGGSYQFDFIRYCKDGVVGEFMLTKTTAGIKTVYTNSFDKALAQRFAGITKAGLVSYIKTVAYNEPEYKAIVFYKNKILVIDITMNGKLTDKKIKYREMYYGVEQQFDW